MENKLVNFFEMMQNMENGNDSTFVMLLIKLILSVFMYFEVMNLGLGGFVEPHTLYAENTIYLFHKINCYLFLIWPLVFSVLIKTLILNNKAFYNIFETFTLAFYEKLSRTFFVKMPVISTYVANRLKGKNEFLLTLLQTKGSNESLKDVFDKSDDLETSEYGQYEITLTVTPVIILILIFIESGLTVYAADAESQISSFVNVKVIGGQWYWVYDISFDVVGYKKVEGVDDVFIREVKHINQNYVSNLVTDDDLQEGELRMLQVDNVLYLPVNVPVKANITSRDVLHSFALPSGGWKMDAVPGRLNELVFIMKQPGVYVGMCSELCGVGHSAMPIMVHVVSLDEFLKIYGVSVDSDWVLYN